MESAAKLLQRHQPPAPLSVIMERSAEDANASTSTSRSRPSSTSNRSSSNRTQSQCPTMKENAENLRGDGTNASFTSMSGSSFSKKASDSFASLSESQARDLFDNDAKDRIEFLTSQLDTSEIQPHNLNGTVDESLGTYFMRRSSHPVKGLAEESVMFNQTNFMDGTIPGDFDNTRSLSSSTPLPHRSPRQELVRSQTALDMDESVVELPNFVANESIVALYDYFKGPQSDGKRKDSMIDYVLEYCNKLKPQQTQPASSTSSTSAPPPPKVPKSPVKLDNRPIGQNAVALNQSTTSLASFQSFAKPNEHKNNGMRVVRHESKTQLNLSFHEKSVVVHKKMNKAISKSSADLQSKPSNKLAPPSIMSQSQQLAPPQPQNVNVTSQYQYQQQQLQPITIPTSANPAVGVGPNPSTYQQYPSSPVTAPYGLPLVIQMYFPYPGYPPPLQSGPQPQSGTGPAVYVQPPAPQLAQYQNPQLPPQPIQSQAQPVPEIQPLHASSTPNQPQMPQNSHQLTCEAREKVRNEREDGLSEYKENVPPNEDFQKPNLLVDKLAIVWEGCHVGGHTIEKLMVSNKGESDLAVRCTFADSDRDIFMMFIKAQDNGFFPNAKTVIKKGENRVMRIAFRPKESGQAVGKLRLEFVNHPLVERDKDHSRRLSFVSYIPLVGFGYGSLNDSCLV